MPLHRTLNCPCPWVCLIVKLCKFDVEGIDNEGEITDLTQYVFEVYYEKQRKGKVGSNL